MYRYYDQPKHTDVISVYVAIGLKRSSVVQMMKTLENLIVYIRQLLLLRLLQNQLLYSF
jgi:hypothetical protein